MTEILIAFAVLLALGAFGLLLRQRRRSSLADQLHVSPHAQVGGSAELAVGPGPDDVLLVPLPNDSGQALAIGSEHALAAFDAAGLAKRGNRDGSGAVPQLVRNAMAASGLEATNRFQRGVDSGRIVALAPETMEHLRKGKPVFDKSGNVLALVRGDNGKLKHVMRLDKAGAQAAAASNMATLAVTAALSQQLEAISQQLEELSETLGGMVRDKDRERLSDALAANEILSDIAESVRRRGITESDFVQLAALKHRVTALQIETTAKLTEVEPGDLAKLGRNKRRELLAELYEKERLEYWLTVQVQADLARTRADLLTLLWEHHTSPETAPSLNRKVADAIQARQRRAAEIGEVLRALADPAAHTRLDPLRLIARHHLGREQVRIEELLLHHGDAFGGPEDDLLTVDRSALRDGEQVLLSAGLQVEDSNVARDAIA